MTWGDAWDDIELQIDWTGNAVLNDNLDAAALTMPFKFRAISSAGTVVSYQVKEDGGAYGGWLGYYPDPGKRFQYMTTTFTFTGYGERTAYVNLKDDDGNTHELTATVVITESNEELKREQRDTLPRRVKEQPARVGGVAPVRAKILAKHRR